MPKPVSTTKSQVQSYMKTFERVLKKAEDEKGRVSISALKAEVEKRALTNPELADVFSKSVGVLEKKFERTVTVGCSSTTKKPKTLSAREVKSVLAAMIEARGKGLEKIAGGDAKITPKEASKDVGSTLSDNLAEAAARAVTHATAAPARRRTKPRADSGTSGSASTGSVSTGSVSSGSGCGGTSTTTSSGC